MGRSWELVNFSDKSPDEGFYNLRAYMWGQIEDWCKMGGALPDNDTLYEDLISVDTKPTLNGVIQLRSKEDMKKDGLPSPNEGDSLALSFARPVVKKDRSALVARSQRVARSKYLNSDGDYVPTA